jgi:hypothetical protein
VQPSVGLDTDFSPNSDYSLFLDLKQRAGMVKVLAGIDFVSYRFYVFSNILAHCIVWTVIQNVVDEF